MCGQIGRIGAVRNIRSLIDMKIRPAEISPRLAARHTNRYKPQSLLEALTSFDVAEVTQAATPTAAFKVKLDGGAEFLLYAGTESERQSWLQAFSEVLQQLRVRKPQLDPEISGMVPTFTVLCVHRKTSVCTCLFAPV